MGYLSSFAISASGLTVEKARLDATAVNIANIHSTRSIDGGPYRPIRVISGERGVSPFAQVLDTQQIASGGVQVVSVSQLEVPPRLVHEPSHPDADAKGFVHYPGIDHASEMINLITAMRAYEANLVALGAAKAMAVKALEIGGQS